MGEWRGEEKGVPRIAGNVLWLPGRGRLAKGPSTSPFLSKPTRQLALAGAGGPQHVQASHPPAQAPPRLRNNRSLAVHSSAVHW